MVPTARTAARLPYAKSASSGSQRGRRGASRPESDRRAAASRSRATGAGAGTGAAAGGFVSAARVADRVAASVAESSLRKYDLLTTGSSLSRRPSAAEARKHPAAYPQVHVTSSEKGMGIAELRAAVLGDAGV